MKSLMTFIVVVLVLSALALVFYGGYWIVGYIWQLFYEMESTLRLVLLSTFAVFLSGCFIIAGALKSAGQAKLKAQLAEAKIELYKTMVGSYEVYFSAQHDGVKSMKEDTLDKLQELTAELSMIADGSVLEIHRKLVQDIRRQESAESEYTLYQQLIKKMRLDLGHTPNLGEAKLNFLNVNQNSSPSTSVNHEVSV